MADVGLLVAQNSVKFGQLVLINNITFTCPLVRNVVITVSKYYRFTENTVVEGAT